MAHIVGDISSFSLHPSVLACRSKAGMSGRSMSRSGPWRATFPARPSSTCTGRPDVSTDRFDHGSDYEHALVQARLCLMCQRATGGASFCARVRNTAYPVRAGYVAR